jgi:uncharacterized coiled-coil protein SlyX
MANPWADMTSEVEVWTPAEEERSWRAPWSGRYVVEDGVRRWRPWSAEEWRVWKTRGADDGGGDGGSGGTGGGGGGSGGTGGGGGGPRINARLVELEKRVAEQEQIDDNGYTLRNELDFIYGLMSDADEEVAKLKAEVDELKERIAAAEVDKAEVDQLKSEMAEVRGILKERGGWIRAPARGSA